MPTPCAYSKKYNYIINWTGKSGCTMFRRLFLSLHEDELPCEPKNAWHQIEFDFPLDKNKNKEEIPNIYLVRNPYKRVVSMFTNKYCGVHSVLPRLFILEKITFRCFILKLLELKKHNRLKDIHIIEQSFYYKSNANSHVIRLEEFNSKILDLYENLNLGILCPQINKFLGNIGDINKTTKNTNEEMVFDKEYTVDQKIFPDYKYFYNQELLDLVYEIYKEDFINFDYKKNELL